MNTRLKLSLSETDTGAWTWSPDTNTIVWHEASERLFGYDPGEFPGTVDAFASRVNEADFPAVQEAIDTAVETGEEFRADFRAEPADGKQRWVRARGVVETDDSNTTPRVIGIQTDITDIVEQRQALERKNEQLDQFASVVAHDLRNPLSIAIGFTDIAQEMQDSGHFEKVENAHDRIERLIEDLLTLARGETTITESTEIDVGMVAAEAWGDVDTHEATLGIDEDIPVVSGDDGRLIQLFENCFRNAVEHGGNDVTVTVGRLPDDDGFYVVTVQVFQRTSRIRCLTTVSRQTRTERDSDS